MKHQRTVVLATYDQEPLKKAEHRKFLLAGDTVFASLQPSVPSGFVRLSARAAVSGLSALWDKNAPKVFIAVDERLYASAKSVFALAFEGYLSWGLRECRKGTLIVFGGAETSQSTSVQILIFNAGRLVELDEKILPELTATYFKDALQDMLAELRVRYPTARMVQAAPLTQWGVEGINYIGDKPIRFLFYRQLTRAGEMPSIEWLPHILVTLSILFYVGALVKEWHTYNAASDFYDIESSDYAIQAQGGISTSLLSVMSSRRDYMSQTRRQAIVVDKVGQILRGIAAVTDVRIIELKLPVPPSDADRPKTTITLSPEQLSQLGQTLPTAIPPDVWITISVPRSSDPAVAQAKSVMTQIARHAGFSWRLADQGWQENSLRRIFKIEGFIHD